MIFCVFVIVVVVVDVILMLYPETRNHARYKIIGWTKIGRGKWGGEGMATRITHFLFSFFFFFFFFFFLLSVFLLLDFFPSNFWPGKRPSTRKGAMSPKMYQDVDIHVFMPKLIFYFFCVLIYECIINQFPS